MASEEFKKDLGPKIRAARIWSGMSLIDASISSGLSISSIYEYEAGRKAPDAESLSRLADALGLSTDQVIGRQPLPEKRPFRA